MRPISVTSIDTRTRWRGAGTALAIIVLSVAAIMALPCASTGTPRAFAQAPTSAQPDGPQPDSEQPGSARPDSAQQAGEQPAQAQNPPATQIAGWNDQLESVENALGREGIGDKELIELASQLTDVQAEASAMVDGLQPQVIGLRQQLSELGEVPADGAAESAELSERRSRLNGNLAELDGFQREARLVVLRVSQIESALLAKRQQRFFQNLTARGPGLFSPALWSGAAAGLPDYLSSLSLQFRDTWHFVGNQISERPLRQALFLAELIFIVAMFAIIWRWLHRRARAADARQPQRGMKDWTALGRLQEFGASGVLPVLALAAIQNRLGASMLLPDRFFDLVTILLTAVALLIVVSSLFFIFVNPFFAERRIARLSDKGANHIWLTAGAGLITIVVVSVLEFSTRQLLGADELVRWMAVIPATVGIVTTVWCLLVIGRDTGSDANIKNEGLLNWRNIAAVVWITSLVGVVALVAGYVRLARFAVGQIVILLFVAGMLWLVLRLIDEIKQRFARSDASAGEMTGAGHQLAVIGFGIARLIASVMAVFALLVPWGIQSQDWMNAVRKGFFGFQVGDLRVSFSAMLTALAVLLVGMVVTGRVRQWVSSQYLPTTRLDRGLRNSITTIIGYAGVILSVLLAVTAAGFDFTSIALVAGALSVGIGLGLQSIVNNFVSGLILLAERPIKTGDWIVTSGGQGTVRRISVRSTEIETFDGATVIVPNSNLITESVTNWNHRDSKGRITIAVGVGYSSDPDHVREILMESAKAHTLVIEHPAPQVLFMDYGSDALIFELRAYLADVTYSLSTASDLRFDILRRLREAGIEIPFPQRDLHIKSGGVVLTQPDDRKDDAATGQRARIPATASDNAEGS